MRHGVLGWFSQTRIILGFLVITLLNTFAFYFVIQESGGPLLDGILTGDEAISRLLEMDAYQRAAHFWGTVTLDVLYPLVYGGLFIGVLSRFAWRWRWVLILVPIICVLSDFAENAVQAMALSGSASEILLAKDIVSPIKMITFLSSLGLCLLVMLVAGVRKLARKETESP